MLLQDTFKHIIDHSFEAILIAELKDGKPLDLFSAEDVLVVYVNKAFTLLTGVSEDNVVGHHWDEKLFPGDDIDWVNIANQVYKVREPFIKVLYSHRFNIHLRAKINFLSDTYFFAVIEDVSNERELEKKLKYSIYNDPLTGLPNKTYFLKDLEDCLALAQANSEKLGLLFLCHDNLRLLNDTHGHKAGDELLCECANRLRRFSDKKLRVARFDGNEFVIIAKLTSDDEMFNIADAVFEVLREPYELSVGVAPSVLYGGVALYPTDAQTSGDLLKYADIAMANAKTQQTSSPCMFRSVMQEQLLKRVFMSKKLSNAAETMDFEIYYQPQVDVVSGFVRGFEALLRWTDSVLGKVSPEVFIPVAEESGEIVPIGLWVLRNACAKCVEWREKFGFEGVMSVNVSPVQLRSASFIKDLKDIIEETKIIPKQLEVEITEGVFIDDLENAVSLLQKIRDLGIGIALDDFGTGYSSLSYLHYLPLSTLKIDKSFIFNIHNHDKEQESSNKIENITESPLAQLADVEENIADTIVTLANKLGFNTVAEGVETTFQLNFLSRINCKIIQGFLTGKPLCVSDCEKLLQEGVSQFEKLKEN